MEFILPLAVKSGHLLSHKSQSVTRERSYSECYYYVTRANVWIDGIYFRFVFAFARSLPFFFFFFFLFFKYSSKISVTFEKCQVNVSSMQLYQKEFESFAFYICIISLNSPFSINFIDKLSSKN